MYILFESEGKNYNGIYDFSIIMVNDDNSRKRYTFYLNDSYLVNKIKWMIAKGKELHGYVIDMLKKNNIKSEIDINGFKNNLIDRNDHLTNHLVHKLIEEIKS